MKQLLIAALFLGNSIGQSWACEPSSPEMNRYLNQKNWQGFQLHDDSGTPPVAGFTDGQGRFYFGDMSRGGTYSTKLTIDAKNQSYQEFFADCRSPDKKGGYLRSMRRNGENNSYKLSVRYLPAFSSLTNDPLADQAWRDTHLDLVLKFDSSSILRTQEWYGSPAIADVTKYLKSQLANQPEFGVFTFDLTGWDDVVCDLIQGRATLVIKKSAISNSPTVVQEQVVDPQDLSTLSQALKSSQQSMSKEQTIYFAARTQARLENDRQIKAYDEKLGFKIVQSLMNPEMTRFLNPSADDLLCAGDRLQSYKQDLVTQTFDIGLKLPAMDELKP